MTFIQKYFAQFDVENLLMKGVSLVLLCLFYLVAKRMIHFAVKRALSSSVRFKPQEIGRQKTVLRLLENSLNYALVFLILYWVLAMFGLPVSSLLAGAGIAGVAIGLGAQGFLSDLVNGFFILVERQFDVGDHVKLTNGPISVSGTVVSVGIRTTQVRDADGALHFIPNRNILVVSNRSRGNMRIQVDLPIVLSSDLEQVDQVVQTVNQTAVPQYEAVKGITVVGPQFSDAGQFVYRVQLFVENGHQAHLYPVFYRLYQEAFRKAGIDFVGLD